MIKSRFTGKFYDPDKCCRIVNMTQLAFYMENDVELLELYPSKDRITGKPILVGIVSRADSYDAYNKWCLMGKYNKTHEK